MSLGAQFRLLAATGLLLAIYALYVEAMVAEYRLKGLGEFQALCDLGTGISCSKVFTGPYGHLIFGLPNALLGVLFYVACLVGSLTSVRVLPGVNYLVLFACACSAAFSVLLAVLLYRLGDFCLLCISTHVINFLLLYRAAVNVTSPHHHRAHSAKVDKQH